MRIAIAGTCGVPGKYGGFETLAENLVRYKSEHGVPADVSVYCSSRMYPERPENWMEASLRYIPLEANGPSSIFYDLWSMFSAAREGVDAIILLGVSGGIGVPLLKLFSRVRVVTNVDGMEWRRQKWGWLARTFLRLSERFAVKFSDVVIADNDHIKAYIGQEYGKQAEVIAYGGDHALGGAVSAEPEGALPGFALALCRIEPENNVEMILEAFADSGSNLVFIGNWEGSAFGRRVRRQYSGVANIRLLAPIYDIEVLAGYRRAARAYIHGHSAGGTNPSLVEAMHFDLPVFAFDCAYNRCTTEGRAMYFGTATELRQALASTERAHLAGIGKEMGRIARARYTWAGVAAGYFRLCGAGAGSNA